MDLLVIVTSVLGQYRCVSKHEGAHFLSILLSPSVLLWLTLNSCIPVLLWEEVDNFTLEQT